MYIYYIYIYISPCRDPVLSCPGFLRVLFLDPFYSYASYINDMPNNISSTIRLYADDALLYRSIHNEKDVYVLLDLLISWAAEWQMT